ncbi:hypothetical protein COU89_00465 [Candidatus Roizmanbacteria bacterium CG10_big_fil_rev_8_21_14_0_10_45_7]|uniref:Uncharacterized protein n=1 Tax=Candidatus Roizmanbacteria bacterium CG10_big_fil_rev_8_21_14_0_10_45_7 TaxID=1974854 RepID=A0A2M8KVL6_9BACT|nr:MAG: hypothetical protein COU89_00465 [Candidatus Roizmanbacteria bacterium CG10_big_fil_rev_8_21_14_0_10_45_7]
MSLEIDEYPHKEVYYFLPLVRKLYALMLQHEVPEQHNPALINSIKELAQYYAQAFLTDDIVFSQEDQLMTTLMNDLNAAFGHELSNYLSLVHEGQQYKTDGDMDRYVYGSLSAETFARTDISDGRLTYDAGSTGGLLHLKPFQVHDTLSRLATYITEERCNLPVEIWGNVAHGIVDAAAIYQYLQRNNIPTSLHLCRYSPHAFHDTQTHAIEEPYTPEAWNIAVDSLVSDEGTTVNQLLAFVRGSRRSSVWTTWNGINYCNKHQGIVVPSLVTSQLNGCGVLIEPVA